MNGVLILDKPADFTSFDVVAVARGLTREKKIGHTGTLDPMATGVLPLLLGKAAKAADLLVDTDKTYRAGFRLGEQRETGDVTGEVVRRDDVPISREMLEQAARGFLGTITQVAPMYSAVSVGGKRLYQLAREGVQVERPARQVTIYDLAIEAYDPAAREGVLTARCSKGTYIRVLLEDLGAACGSCGTMTALRRTAACGFDQSETVTLDRLKELAAAGEIATVLRPVESLFRGLPAVRVSPAQARRFCNGGGLDLGRLRLPEVSLPAGERLRVYEEDRAFLGLGAVDPDRGELRFLKKFTD